MEFGKEDVSVLGLLSWLAFEDLFNVSKINISLGFAKYKNFIKYF